MTALSLKRAGGAGGFTLIELLVVIAIIGLLSSVVLASLNSARDKAKIAKLKADIHSIQAQIALAQTNGQVLGVITGSFCTSCAFTSGSLMATQAAAMATNATSWQRIGFSQTPIDPWGSPYSLDENELEFNSSDCRYDYIYSAGPDRLIFTSDDYSFTMQHVRCYP